MKEQSNKKSQFPTKANEEEQINVHNELKANKPLPMQNKFAGDSVDEHKRLEAANEIIAKKEISQTYNNS
ncbi:hypothetical protein [Virgibacillus alimentarius]|uniref:Uncharacterized protein n=1 Tax=Virgibacillus alimentarius TaxID=698769 RepID=A0ABS4S759_9BACI|nr:MULTISPECIES: hypothetical protein [Virgibacillus]MBP2257337.1 hypothetical protein [Virgibacillus alimentarius]HLR68638.1 hypothetical protein [Virgibacillus sp.]